MNDKNEFYSKLVDVINHAANKLNVEVPHDLRVMEIAADLSTFLQESLIDEASEDAECPADNGDQKSADNEATFGRPAKDGTGLWVNLDDTRTWTIPSWWFTGKVYV